MADWKGLKEWLREQYTLEDDKPSWVGLVFEFEDGRTQKVVVEPFEAFNRSWVEIRSLVCDEEALSAKAALKKNASIGIGALYLKEGKIYLSYSVQLDDLSVEELEIPLHAVAYNADAIESQLSERDEN